VIRNWLALATALAVEAASMAQVLSAAPGTALPRVLVLHTAAALLVGWAARGNQTRRGTAMVRQIFAAAMTLIGLPVFGIAAVLSYWLASSVLVTGRGRGVRPDVDASAPVSDRHASGSIDLYAPLDTEPLVDLLHDSDPDLKRGAIETLVGIHGSRAAGMLRSLLHDDDPEIRLYASIRLSGLEDEMGRAIQTARAATEASPSEVDAWRRLVLACSAYVTSGLLDTAMARQCLLQAEHAYEVASKLQPDLAEVALALGRACQAARQFGAAREYFEQVARGSNTTLSVDARIGLMELAFERRALAEVKAYAALTAPDMHADDPRRELVEWWAEER
jgi:tetratricopeptide (TPR) repeat protein